MNILSFSRLAACVLFVGVTQFSSSAATPASEPVEPVKALASDADDFATDLYDHLAPNDGNLFFSYSIHAALTMTYAGARGGTASQMARLLHLSLPPERLHQSSAELSRALKDSSIVNGKAVCELAVANGLWGEKGFTCHPAFIELLRRDYGAGLEQVDFSHAPDASRRQINDWVSKQTKEKIKDLLPPRSITDQTRLVLANAIYFKGSWVEPFKPDATRDEPFHADNGKDVKVPMMLDPAGSD